LNPQFVGFTRQPKNSIQDVEDERMIQGTRLRVQGSREVDGTGGGWRYQLAVLGYGFRVTGCGMINPAGMIDIIAPDLVSTSERNPGTR